MYAETASPKARQRRGKPALSKRRMKGDGMRRRILTKKIPSASGPPNDTMAVSFPKKNGEYYVEARPRRSATPEDA